MIFSAALNKLIRAFRRGLARPVWNRLEQRVAIKRYLRGGRRPWSRGYVEYRARYIAGVLDDPSLADLFRGDGPLPGGYGERLDERVVELPWAMARLADCGPHVLDAGSALNHDWLLDHPTLKAKSLVICTLAPEDPVASRANVSHIYGDLRNTVLRDGCFDAVACISTLEHIGLDNTRVYPADARFAESRPTDWRAAVAEFRRVLAPGGRLLITVPFGKAANLGWLQVFDKPGVEAIVGAFSGKLAEQRFYRYTPDGWSPASAEACAECRYFDFNATPAIEPDGAAAARAVACLQLVREP